MEAYARVRGLSTMAISGKVESEVPDVSPRTLVTPRVASSADAQDSRAISTSVNTGDVGAIESNVGENALQEEQINAMKTMFLHAPHFSKAEI
jgi:hypothetical protein